MIASLVLNGAPATTILICLFTSFPAIVLSLSIHEWAHGYVAYLLGDPTAYYQGRLTINPLKHLDVVGTISMLLLGLGWARPVPIDSRYLKYPKWYIVIISIAGPFSNLLLAFVSLPIMKLLCYITVDSDFLQKLVHLFIIFFYFMFIHNVVLSVFNLLIFPPLDGSRIVMALLPTRAYVWVMKNEAYIRYVMFGLLLLCMFVRIQGVSVLSTIINFFADPVEELFFKFWNLIIPTTVKSINNFSIALQNIAW